MQIKVLYVVPPSAHFAGIERVVHDVASGLAANYRDRIQVTVLYCHRYPELPGELPYRVIWEDISKLRSFPFRVGRWLGKETYDIVVTAQFEPTMLLWLARRFRPGNTRFVIHLHGNPKVEGSGSRKARLVFLFFNAMMVRMAKVLAVSPSLAHYIENRIDRHGLVEYVPNPVRQFTGATRERPSGGPVSFVSVGRLAQQKGHDILIDAFAEMIADHAIDATLTIVGDGDERPALASQIARLGLGDRVRLAGPIPNPIAELSTADCFVSASRWEGFGVAIVEALSAGLYVIATDCEFGPGDLIDSDAKGRIVPMENITALARAMADFARGDRAEQHDGVRRDAAAVFSLDNVVAKHAAVLEAISGRVMG